MQWSKLKQRIEATFADSVKGRVEVWSTSYRGAHDQVGEVWITLDGERLHSMGTLKYWRDYYDRYDVESAVQGGDVHRMQAEIDYHLSKTGVVSEWDARAAVFDYLNLSMDQVVASDIVLIRAFATLDRRLGKRRLTSIEMDDEEPLVREFHALRCRLEGIESANNGRGVV